MKKFLSYVLTFALLFFITAAATVSMASGNGSGLINPGVNNSQQASSSSLFNGILDTFGKHKKFNVKGEIKLTYKETELPVNLFVDVDISDSNNIKVNGYLNVKYEGNSNVVKFSFYNNTIYLSYKENNIKIETQTIFDLIEEISNLIPSSQEAVDEDSSLPNNESGDVSENIPSTKDDQAIEDSEANQDSQECEEEQETDILESLMPMLMEALNNMVETKLENGNKRIAIAFEDLLDVILVADSNNIPKTVILETENFKGYKLYANIDLEFNDDIFILNPETKQNALDYFDLKTYKDVIKNLLSLNNFNSDLSLKINGKAISFNVLANLSSNDYDLKLLSNDFGYVQDFNVIYSNNNAYLSVNDINLLFSEQLITQSTKVIDNIINLDNINFDLVLNKLSSFTKAINIQELNVQTALALLVCVKDFSINANELSFIIDTSVFGLDIGTVEFGINYEADEIQGIYLNGLIVKGNSVDLSLNVNKTEEIVDVLNSEKYLNVYDLINNNKEYFSSDSYDIDFDLLFNNNENNFKLDSLIQFDLSDEYLYSDLKFNLNGKLIPIEIEYIGNCAYVKYNDVKLKMSKAQAKELINSLGLEFEQKNYQQIISDLDFNIDEETLILALSSLKNVQVCGNQVTIEIDLNKFGFDLNSSLVIVLEDSIVKQITINVNYEENNVFADINVLDNCVTEKEINTEEYLDVVSLAGNIKNLLNMKEGQISVDASILLDNKSYFADLDLIGSLNKEYLNIGFNLSGDSSLDFNLAYYDKQAFVNVNDIYIKSEINNILALFTLFELPTKQELGNLINSQEVLDLSIFENGFDLSILNNIKELKVSSNEIKVCINKNLLGLDEDLTIILTLNNNNLKSISVCNLSLNGALINVTISVEEKVVNETKVEKDKYLDIEALVRNVVSLVSSNILNISLDAKLYDENSKLVTSFDFDFSKLFENDKLLLNLFAGLTYDDFEFKLNGIYQDNTTFVEFGGLKLMLETGRIYESVSRIMGILNENPEIIEKIIYKVESFLNVGDLTEFKDEILGEVKQSLVINQKDLFNIICLLISELDLTSNGISAKIDGKVFGYEGTICLEILFKNNNISQVTLNNLKVNDYQLDVNLSVNTIEQEMETISVSEKEEYINVAELSEVIESAYNTIKTKSITGIATIKFNYGEELVLLNVNYGFKLDENNKLVVYLSTKFMNKDINVYFKDKCLFVDIQGLKTKIEINEIPKLINWINSEFNLGIDFNSLDTSKIEEKLEDIYFILGAVANMDVSSVLDKVVFNENSMEIIINENSSVFVNYNTIIEQVIVHESGKYFELNIEPCLFALNDIDFTQFVSYESIIDIYNSIINTIHTENNLEFNLSLNINNQNVSAIVQLDKNYNIQVTLTNNTFGVIDSLIITYIDGEVYLKINDVYVLVTEKLISDMPAYLSEINMFRLESEIYELYNFILNQKETAKNINPLVVLNYLENITLTTTGISVKLNSKELNLGNQIILSLTHNTQAVTNVNISGLNIKNNKLGLNVIVKETAEDVSVENKEKYNDIYETILTNIDYFNNGELDFSLDFVLIVNNEQIPVNGNIKFNINNDYVGLNLFVGYKTGYTLNVEITEGEIYLTINNIKAKVSQEQLMNFISSLDLTEIYNLIESVYNSAKQSASKISYKDVALKLISTIKYVTLNSNEIGVKLNGEEINTKEDIKVSLILENNTLKSINLSETVVNEIGVLGKITINSNKVIKNVINKSEYIDIANLLSNVDNLFKATQGEINLNLDANVFNKNYVLNLGLEGNLFNKYFDLILELGGGYDLFANLTKINGELYAQINDIYVKADIKTVLGLILSQGLSKNDVDLSFIEDIDSIVNIKSFVDDFNLLDLFVIKNIKANNNAIEIIIDKAVMGGLNDLVVKVVLNDNLPTNITISNLFIDSTVEINTLSLSFTEKEVQEKEFNTTEYLDLEDTINKASKLPYLNNLNAVLGVNFYTFNNEKYSHELGVEFDYKKHIDENSELWSLLLDVINKENVVEMSAVYENQKIFTNYNGLKLLLETNEISNIVDTILSIAGIENNYNDIISRVVTFLEGKGLINALSGIALPTTKTPDFNTLAPIALFAAENLSLSSDSLLVNIDGNILGYNGTISLKINFENNNISKITMSKLKVEDIYMDITLDLSLEEQTIETVPEEEQEYYINVAELTEVINSVYNTITQDYVTGNVNLTLDILNKTVPLTVYYGIGNNNGTFEVYVELEYNDILVTVVYQKGSIYVDIQGMKVQLSLNNINEIISWVENEFGVDINEDNINNEINKIKDYVPKTIEEIVEFMSKLDLSFIEKVEFVENTTRGFIPINLNKTMIVSLINGISLSFDYGEKIESVKVEKQEETIVSVNVDETPVYAENYSPEIEKDAYNSYTDLTELVSLLKQTIFAHNKFSFDILLNLNGNDVKFNTLIDVNTLETSFTLKQNTFGYIDNLNIVYINDSIYVRVNDIYVLLSKALIKDAPELADSLLTKLNVGVSVQDITDLIKQKAEETKDINYLDYLKYVKSLNISANELSAIINANILGLGDYEIEIVIRHNKEEIEDIFIQGLIVEGNRIDLGLVVKHYYNTIEQSNPEKFIDIYQAVKENIEFFKTGELDLDINFELDSEIDLLAQGNIKLDLNNKEFGLRLDIVGDYNLTLNIDYYNNTAYVEINSIKVKTTLDKVQDLLKEFGLGINVEEEFNKLLSKKDNIDVSIDAFYNALNKLLLTSGGVELNYNLNVFGIDSLLDLNVNLENYLAKEIVLNDFSINGLVVNVKVNVNNNSVQRSTLDEEEYLDIVDTVFKAEELLYNENLNALLGIDIYNQDLIHEIGFEFDYKKLTNNNQVVWALIAKVISGGYVANMNATYQEQAIFAEFNGLKLMLETDKLQELLNTICYIVGINNTYSEIIGYLDQILEGNNLVSVLGAVELPQVNVEMSNILPIAVYTLDNLSVTSNNLLVQIDGNLFGYNGIIDIKVNFNNNYISKIVISKLRVGDIYIDISLDLSLEKPTIETVDKEEQEYYININKLAEVVEAGYNTIMQSYITGNVYITTGLFGEEIELNINYGVGYNNGFEIYLDTEYKGINLALIYKDESIYLNVQGMKIKVELDEIESLISWIETEFNIDIDENMANDFAQELEQSMPTTIEEIVKFISELDLAIINKVLFNNSTMLVQFNNGLHLTIGYLNKIKNIEVNFENIDVQVNIDEVNNNSDNYEDNMNLSSYVSYESLTNLVSIVKELINNNKFNINLDVNFNELNVKLNALLDINNLSLLANVSHNLGYIKNLEVVYINNNVYLKANDLYILVSEELIKDSPELLKQFGLELNTNELTQKLETSLAEINILDYLKYLENITLTENSMLINVNAQAFGLGDYVITLTIKFNEELENIALNNVKIDNNTLDLVVEVEGTDNNVVIDAPEKYLDIYNVVKENYEFFKTGELDLDINLELDSEIDLTAQGNIKLDLNNKEFGLRLDIVGDYNLTLNIDYYNDTAYVEINSIKVKTTLDKVQDLLKEFGLEFDIESEINSLLNSTPEINVSFDEIWNAIEKLILTSNGLELNLNLNVLDINSLLDLTVNIENYLAKEIVLNDFSINGLVVNAKVNVNNNSVQRNTIEEESYLDIAETVLNVKDLVVSDIINLLAEVKIYDANLNEKFGIDLDINKIFKNGNLNAEMLINLLYNSKAFNIKTVYQDNTWFASFNDLKVMLEKDRLEETVQRILSIFSSNVHEYDDILEIVISLLEGKDIINVVSGLDITLDSVSTESLDIQAIIKEALKNVEINNNQIKLSVDGGVFNYDGNINLTITLSENNIQSIKLEKLKIGEYYIDFDLFVNTEREDITIVSSDEKASYINLAELSKVAKATYNTFETGTISGFFTLGFTFAGERNLLNVNYGISFNKEKGYMGYIQTNFKGLDVNVYFIDNIIYLDIIGLKIHLSFSDINALMEYISKFGVEIDFDFTTIEDLINGESELASDIDIKSILDMIFDIDLGFVSKVLFTETSLDAYFNGGLNIFVNYLDKVQQVIFNDGDIYVELNCTDFDDFALNINKDKFNSYTVVTNMVDSAIELLKKKQVSMDAEALVYEYGTLADTVDIDLAINTQDTFNVYAGVIVNKDKDTNIHFAYQDDYIFANYENLKLSLSQKSLKELLVIVLEALGVDAETVGFLGDVAEDMNLNTDNLEEIMPSLDFGNPLNMLKLIKSIDIVDGEFIITIDGKALTGSEKSLDMTLKVKAEDNDISTIKLGNVYSNGEKQSFDLNINFKDYNGVKQITDKETYIDISGSAGILKAFVNTSNLTDYAISGTITVTATVVGIDINMDIPVEARVKIVDGETITYVVLDVPVIGSNVPGFTGINVNNDVPYEFGDTSVESRRLEIMYKDDFLYFYRKDVVNQTVFADRVYEKTLKLNGSEMTADLINYLLSYGLGFSDTIMAEIDKAVEKATNRADNPLDVSNILKGFAHTDETDLYSILVNLAEIANNELLGDALINIYTVNNESTSYKDYIGKLAFDINMPLASVCEINLDTDDLTLNNIGQTVDISNVDSYASNYQFKENQQYEKSGDDWVFAGEKQYTIKFVDSMGNTISDISAPVDTAISLPTLETIVSTQEDGEHTYTFDGWYLTEECKESDKVNYTVMPRGNRTLYAKWNESIKYYKHITLDSMGGGQDQIITGLEGKNITLPTLENKIVVDGQTKITYGFTGWFNDSACTIKSTINEIPSEDITLYAGWVEVDRYVAYRLQVIDNGSVVYDQYVGEGSDIELSGFTIDSYTKYYLTQDWTNEYTVGKMTSNDLTLYVRNRYALNIVSVYGDVYDTTEYHYQGEAYSLPGQNGYVTDDGNTQVTYTFNGWEGETDVMPNSNLRVVASWTVVTKYYYDVTFNLAYNGNAAYYKYAKLYKNGVELGSNEITVRVLEGNLDLSEYSADWIYKAWIYYHYNFQGFSTSKNGSAVTSVNITGNTTIYGLWSGLKTGKS